jgi:hypothetical protein
MQKRKAIKYYDREGRNFFLLSQSACEALLVTNTMKKKDEPFFFVVPKMM